MVVVADFAARVEIRASHNDDVDLACDQLTRESRKTFAVAVRPAVLDVKVLTNHITVLTQAIQKPLVEHTRWPRAVHEISDLRDFSVLLRARRRQRRCQ